MCCAWIDARLKHWAAEARQMRVWALVQIHTELGEWGSTAKARIKQFRVTFMHLSNETMVSATQRSENTGMGDYQPHLRVWAASGVIIKPAVPVQRDLYLKGPRQCHCKWEILSPSSLLSIDSVCISRAATAFGVDSWYLNTLDCLFNLHTINVPLSKSLILC